MVFYFTSEVVSPPYTIYMGIDKHENEDLIKHGWPEDVWFHVDKVSSAHVYLRLPKGQTIEDIPSAVLDDCAQLVKNNSIQGNKMNNVGIVYTPWDNLKKTGDMEVGQIGFHKQKQFLTHPVNVSCVRNHNFLNRVRLIKVEKRLNEIVNRLNKTKTESFPDLRMEREQRDQEERNDNRKELQEKNRIEKEEERKRAAEAEARSYSNLMKSENMKTNKDAGSDSDDFM